MTVPRREKKNPFQEWRKSIAQPHGYREGWNRIFGKKKQFEFDLKETKK